ncbi:NUDIX hydrolase [metagenome]|uniref:NUDIX hydrolase n=1 Tax=metagenome TaxID=256318 RepID=A0A2P2CFB2_9ZZZZ
MDPTRTLPPALAEAARAYAEGDRQPVEPRNAATVVLLRPGASLAPGELEVYLLRRHVGMAFAAGMSVFPGGGVDPRDAELPASLWAGPTPAEWAERMGCTADEAASLVCAAVRETFEESGVLLAGTTTSVVADTTGLEAERAALESRELSFSSLLEERGWVLRTDLLAVLGGWLTPVFEPKRYRTWFFVAAMPSGQVTRDVSSESDQVAWMTLRRAIETADSGEMLLMPPTYATCCEFFSALTPADALAHATALPWEMVEPTADGERLVIPERLVSLGITVGRQVHGA